MMRDTRAIRLAAELSPRERDLLQRYANGQTTPEIAEELGISPKTVMTHKQNALRRLGVHTVTEAVAVAIRGERIE